MSKKILFLGGSGFIGKEIVPIMEMNGYDVLYPKSNELDLTNIVSVDNFFKGKDYDIIIYSAVKGRKDYLNTDPTIFYENMLMFENVYRHKDKAKLFINIDSGFSIQKEFQKHAYSFSKYCTSQRILFDEKSINLRVYGCFGHNEEKHRFFVGNISRYIKKENMIVHQDKVMDFVYTEDLYRIIDWVIKNKNNTLPKNIDCIYNKKYKLSEICNLINTLDNYKVGIEIKNPGIGDPYTSSFNSIPINYIGLYGGIKKCFEILKG